MITDEKKINRLFQYWLFTSLALVFSIVIVGGYTRLTGSGLSITEWELFTGFLPPLNNESWYSYFNAYKEIPQYKLINFDMSLREFKIIFYWEYAHRLLARIIGIFFLIPLIYFYFTKKINIKYIKVCCFIFIMIFLQGIIGWYMVKSGLVNDVSVSHYRLSIHLVSAVLIISSIFWLLRNVILKKNKNFFELNFYNLPFLFLIFLIFIQIIMGAFVSGLKAGQIYQTWPLMGNSYFPNDLLINNFSEIVKFDSHSLVQFYHRNLAYLLIFYSLLLTIYIYQKKIFKLYKPLIIFLFILFLQIILGIYTLISGLNIFLASMHQISGVLLVFSALNLYYLRAK